MKDVKSVLSLVTAAQEYNVSESYLRTLVYKGGVRYVREFSAYKKRIIRYFIYRTDIEDIQFRYILFDMTKWISVAKACEMFGVTRRKVNCLSTTGKIRIQTFNGKRTVLVDDLKEYLKK